MATKIWGPLGWMTLHSISLIYPESPSYEDMEILKRFMELFADTISCPDCAGHFRRMFNTYKSQNPAWFANRREFFIFVCRAHNTVNLRIDKPRVSSIAECLETIKRNTLITSGKTYITNYIAYLIRNWSREQTGEGFILATSAREMSKINIEYWQSRYQDISNIKMLEGDVLTPIGEIPLRQNFFTGQQVQAAVKMPTNIRLSFITNQLKLIRM
jgi:hypothetical protein